MSQLEELLLLLEKAERGPSGPPVEKWHPPLSGDMDMRIAADGKWFHEGDEIKRQKLVNLFASILRKEGEEYFLVTPVEKWRIQVDDLPFIAHSVERVEREGKSHLVFTTNVDDAVIASADHPLTVTATETGEPQPKIHVRAALDARIGRNAFYQLVDWAELDHSAGKDTLIVTSAGQRFSLGLV